MNKVLAVGVGALAVASTGIQANAAQNQDVQVTVNCSYLNVRTGPSTKYRIIGTTTYGKTFDVLSKDDGWYKVEYKGETGWISGKYVKTKSSTSNTLVKNTANEFLNVRSGKGMKYSIKDTIPEGGTATLLSSSGSWWKVKTSDGTIGYAYSGYLKKVGSSTTDKKDSPSGKYELISMNGYGKVINCSSLRLRKSASNESKIITTLSRGTMFKIEGKKGNYYKVETVKGTHGYLHKDYVNANCTSSQYKNYKNNLSSSSANEEDKTVTSSKRQTFINKVKAQVGKPYVYGAAGPNAFDCSGLVYYCYHKTTGKYVNRSAASLAYNGKYVSKSNLIAGDLVFFNSGKSGIHHVGVYVGNGKFIHAPSPGKTVRYENLYSSYYVKGYVTARRLSF